MTSLEVLLLDNNYLRLLPLELGMLFQVEKLGKKNSLASKSNLE